MYTIGDCEEYELGEATYYIKPIPPFKAQKLFGRLQKIVMPAIAEGFGALPKGNSKSVIDAEVDSETIGKAIAMLSDKLDGDSLEELTREILKKEYVSVRYEIEGKEYSGELNENRINILFSGNTFDMYKLMFKVLQVTYGDFFTVAERLTSSLSGVLNNKSQKQVK